MGAKCDKCGAPVLGQADDLAVHCDDCLRIARPWNKGRAAIAYKDVGRKLVLGLKHGDRTDYAPALSSWMMSAGQDLWRDDPLLVPVPLQRLRLLRRKYNQSAELCKWLSRRVAADFCADALHRHKRTVSLDHKSKDERFALLQDAISVNPNRNAKLQGRSIVLIDDVMTSGATLASCAEACLAAGAANVSVLVLARVVKDA